MHVNENQGSFFSSSPWQQHAPNWSQCKRSKCQSSRSLIDPHTPSKCVAVLDTWLSLLSPPPEARVWSHDSSECDQRGWGSGELTGQVWRSQVEEKLVPTEAASGGNAERMLDQRAPDHAPHLRPQDDKWLDRRSEWECPDSDKQKLLIHLTVMLRGGHRGVTTGSLWCHSGVTAGTRWCQGFTVRSQSQAQIIAAVISG